MNGIMRKELIAMKKVVSNLFLVTIYAGIKTALVLLFLFAEGLNMDGSNDRTGMFIPCFLYVLMEICMWLILLNVDKIKKQNGERADISANIAWIILIVLKSIIASVCVFFIICFDLLSAVHLWLIMLSVYEVISLCVMICLLRKKTRKLSF